ncbi:uncharacterized protein METZ01_LOCUS322613, partial [marine metagenome]
MEMADSCSDYKNPPAIWRHNRSNRGGSKLMGRLTTHVLDLTT